jgi:hypothetical protein
MRAWQLAGALLLLAACSQHGDASTGSVERSGVAGRKLAASEAGMGQQLVTAGEPGLLRRSQADAAAALSPEAALEEEIKRRWARRPACPAVQLQTRGRGPWRSLGPSSWPDRQGATDRRH